MTDNDVKTRLGAMEARAPGPREVPNETAAPKARRKLFGSVALAPMLVLAVAATAAAGVAGVAGIFAVTSHEGAENSGQPLAGAQLECMTPPQAESYLAARGYTNVVWQVETGSLAEGVDKSTDQSSAPDHGFVVPGFFFNDGKLFMLVDQRDGTTGVGNCTGFSVP